MAGGAGLDGRGLHVQQVHRLVIAFRIGLDHLHGLQVLEAGLLRNLVLPFVGIVLQMAHVGDIPHIADLVSQMLEQPEQHVVGHSGTGVPQMGLPVHGGTAHIHPHMARMNGHEQFLPVRQRIGQIEISHKKSSLKFRLLIYEFLRNNQFFVHFRTREARAGLSWSRCTVPLERSRTAGAESTARVPGSRVITDGRVGTPAVL